MRFAFAFTAVAALLVTLAFGSPAGARGRATPTPAPTPTPVADPVITKLARQQFVAWQAGKINKTLYSPALVPKLTDDKIEDVSHALGQLGWMTDTVFIGPFTSPDMPEDAHGYIYMMKCQNGNIYLQMIVDGQGKIATIYFKNRLDIDTVEGQPSSSPPPP